MSTFLQYLPAQVQFYFLPLAFVVGGFIIGLFLEIIVLQKIKHYTLKTRWKSDEIIVNALGKMVILWCLIAGIYAAITQLPLVPEFVAMAQDGLVVVIIISFTVVTSRIAAGFVNLYAPKIRGVFASASIFANITKVAIFLMGSLIALQTLGISIAPILTALGVGGLAVALALQDSLSNLFSGLHIIASRQIKPGDFIQLNTGEHGYVHDITWRNTTIKALTNNMIIIPNSKMASSVITNFSEPQEELYINVEFNVNYENDLEKVEQITLEVAEEVITNTPGGVTEFKPFIRYLELLDTNIKLAVIMRGEKYIDQYVLRHEFIKKLHQRYRQKGIYISGTTRPEVD